MSKQWYVLQTYSQFEGQVKRALMERIEREGLQDSFGQIFDSFGRSCRNQGWQEAQFAAQILSQLCVG